MPEWGFTKIYIFHLKLENYSKEIENRILNIWFYIIIYNIIYSLCILVIDYFKPDYIHSENGFRKFLIPHS